MRKYLILETRKEGIRSEKTRLYTGITFEFSTITICLTMEIHLGWRKSSTIFVYWFCSFIYLRTLTQIMYCIFLMGYFPWNSCPIIKYWILSYHSFSCDSAFYSVFIVFVLYSCPLPFVISTQNVMVIHAASLNTSIHMCAVYGKFTVHWRHVK